MISNIYFTHIVVVVVDIPGVDKIKVGEMEEEVARIRKDLGRMRVHSDV